MTHFERSRFSPAGTEWRWVNVGRRALLAGAWLAVALALPGVLHPLGLGTRLLPMHLPVLLAGATVGPVAGTTVGMLAPWLSHLMTGMPPMTPPVAPLMVLELMTYGASAGVLRQWLATNVKNGFLASYLWLVPTLLAGRVTFAASVWLIGPSLGLIMPPAAYVRGTLADGIPGLVVQMLLVPALASFLQRWSCLNPLSRLGHDG